MKATDGLWDYTNTWSENTKSGNGCMRERPGTTAAVVSTIESLPAELIKSVTYDRGTEGAFHWKLRLDYGIDTFHCDPYCSWQKGGVENVNGIIRRYLPIQTDLSQYSDNELMAIQEKINNRPRKILGWKTPNEAYREILNRTLTGALIT